MVDIDAMPMPLKSPEGKSRKTSISLSIERERRIDFLQETLGLRSRTVAIEWCIDTVLRILDKLGPDVSKPILTAASQPQGTTVADALLALISVGVWRRENPSGVASVEGPSDWMDGTPPRRRAKRPR